MALIKVLAVSRPVREKYSQQPGGKYNGVQLVCTLHPGAQERDRGPVLTLLCPATRSMRASAYAAEAATSIDGHQLALLGKRPWLVYRYCGADGDNV